MAMREQDMPGLTSALTAAVNLYEQHPTQVHEPESHLRDLLVFVRSARSICQTLGQSEDELRELEDRAEALRRPLH